MFPSSPGAVQESTTLVVVTAPVARLETATGGVVSPQEGVFAAAVLLCADWLPALSTAVTVYD